MRNIISARRNTKNNQLSITFRTSRVWEQGSWRRRRRRRRRSWRIRIKTPFQMGFLCSSQFIHHSLIQQCPYALLLFTSRFSDFLLLAEYDLFYSGSPFKLRRRLSSQSENWHGFMLTPGKNSLIHGVSRFYTYEVEIMSHSVETILPILIDLWHSWWF